MLNFWSLWLDQFFHYWAAAAAAAAADRYDYIHNGDGGGGLYQGPERGRRFTGVITGLAEIRNSRTGPKISASCRPLCCVVIFPRYHRREKIYFYNDPSPKDKSL